MPVWWPVHGCPAALPACSIACPVSVAVSGKFHSNVNGTPIDSYRLATNLAWKHVTKCSPPVNTLDLTGWWTMATQNIVYMYVQPEDSLSNLLCYRALQPRQALHHCINWHHPD